MLELAVARLVGPAEFALWTLSSLVLTYGAFFHLGILNGANRQVPAEYGSGRTERAEALRRVAATSAVGAAVTSAALILALAFLPSWAGLMPFLLALAALSVVRHAYQYAKVDLRATGQFEVLTRQHWLYAALIVPIGIALTLWLGLSGFLWAQVLVGVATIVYVFRAGRVVWRTSTDAKLTLEMLRIGVPIMLIGLVQGLMVSVDRLVLAAVLPTVFLGYYSLSIVVTKAATLLPGSVAQQVYPQMSAKFGATGDPRALLPLVRRQRRASLLVVMPVVALGFLTLPFAVRFALPDYAPGIPALLVSLLGLLSLPWANAAENLLVVVGDQWRCLVLQLVCVAAMVAADFAFLAWGWGLVGIAAGSVLGYALYAVCLEGLMIARTRPSGGASHV